MTCLRRLKLGKSWGMKVQLLQQFGRFFSGMNLNVRVKGQHVDFEEKTYYASFSGELEASASPMWALVSHLKDSTTRDFTLNVLKHCLTAIREWMVDVEFDSFDKVRAIA